MPNLIRPAILTFNTSDPIGASGIQADLGTFAVMHCHGLSVITAILIGDTAQVEDSQAIEADWVADQARVVLEDVPVTAFKIGVLGSIENVSAIAEIVSDYPQLPLILDPFSSTLPDQGPDHEDMLAATRDLLIPQATVLLLSALELAQLAETWREASSDDMLAADTLHLIESGCKYVLVTNAPAQAHQVVNTLFDANGVVQRAVWPRISGSYSGAGATLSAALAGLLANGAEVPAAVEAAQEFTRSAIDHAQQLGMGKRIPDRYFGWPATAASSDPAQHTSREAAPPPSPAG